MSDVPEGVESQMSFDSEDEWGSELDEPEIEYVPDHPLILRLNGACTSGTLEEVKELVTEWQDTASPSPPRGPRTYPLATLEPIFYQAIRESRADIAAYLLEQGVKMGERAASEAIKHKCPPAVWQVLLDHGLDINAPLGGPSPSPLAFVLHDETLVRWFLAHGADPNIESPQYGLTAFLRAASEAPLATVRLLRGAGGGPTALAVPFACSPLPGTPGIPKDDGDAREADTARRLAILRFLLDEAGEAGEVVSLDVRKWAHNSRGRTVDFDWGSALNYALAHRWEALAEELLCRGARTDVSACNLVFRRGEAAPEIARRYAPRLLPLVEACRARELAAVVGQEGNNGR